MTEFKLTAKQGEAVDVMAANQTALLEGGARSAKTFLIIRAMLLRAFLVPDSWHIGLRLRRNHIYSSVWQQTLPQVLTKCGWKELVNLNHSEMLCQIKQNKSVVTFDGLDNKDRVDKILGKEFSTIFLNEVSQIGFNEYETITTRLNPVKGLNPKIWMDWNPTSKNHWVHKIFRLRKFPDGRDVPVNDFGVIKMNPIDNKENISETLFNTLNNLSGSKRRRFLEGEAGDEDGSLWKRNYLRYGKPETDLVRVVVGVDPSGSLEGDEIGIVAAGMDREGKIFVLRDDSLHASPKEWSEEVYNTYDVTKADTVCAEKNFGGEMVEAVITQMGVKNINVKLVNASRGKAVRAEPIASLYQNGRVFHTNKFLMLEDEMCLFKPTDTVSPNRMDALVWAITELMMNTTEPEKEIVYENGVDNIW